MGKTLSEKRAAAGHKGGSTTWARLRAEGKVAPKKAPKAPVKDILAGLPKVEGDHNDPKTVILETLTMLRELVKHADHEDVPKIANAITSQTNLLAKLTGSLEVSQIQLLRSRAWREAQDIIYHALKPFPEAAKAIAEAFAAWEKR